MVFRGEIFVGWLGHEGGTHMNGISALIRRDTTREMFPLPTMWGHHKKPDEKDNPH